MGRRWAGGTTTGHGANKQGTIRYLAASVDAGRARAGDSASTDGMPAWAVVRDVPAVAVHLPPVAGALTPACGDPLGYVSTGGEPTRVAEALRRYARPIGDDRVAEMVGTVKLHKRIANAAGLVRLLLAPSAIAAVVALVACPGSLAASVRPRIGAMAALGGLAARASLRAHRWGPIVRLVLCLLAAADNVFSRIAGSTATPGGPPSFAAAAARPGARKCSPGFTSGSELAGHCRRFSPPE